MDFEGCVGFVHCSILEKESPRCRAILGEGNDPSKRFYFNPLLSEVIYDRSIWPQAPAETEEWSPTWINLQLDKVYELLPDKALPHLEYFLAHLKDINGVYASTNPFKLLVEVDGVKLDPGYLAGQEDYYYWQDRYLLSPQEIIGNAISSGYRFEIQHHFTGEMAVEQSFDPFITILRHDVLTELKS